MFYLKKISTEKFNLKNSLKVFFFQDQTRILISRTLIPGSFNSRTSWKFFSQEQSGKFLFQEHARILFHEQNFNMFKNRLDLFQEKSGRFHFKNNRKFNFMKKLEFLF